MQYEIAFVRARSRWANGVVGLAACLVGVSVAHVAEDFVYGVPARFGLSCATAATLVGGAYAAQVVLIALAARGRSVGYVGNLVAGLGWAIAAAVDHLGEVVSESSYRAGFISKMLEVAIMAVGLALATVAALAWRAEWEAQHTGRHDQVR